MPAPQSTAESAIATGSWSVDDGKKSTPTWSASVSSCAIAAGR
jgi:hypothetical protein